MKLYCGRCGWAKKRDKTPPSACRRCGCVVTVQSFSPGGLNGLETRDKDRLSVSEERLRLGALLRGMGGLTARKHERPRRRLDG